MMFNKPHSRVIQILIIFLLISSCKSDQSRTPKALCYMGARPVHAWITKADKSLLFENFPPADEGNTVKVDYIIEIDSSKRYQEIQGFGFSLTGGSAQVIMNKLSAENRMRLLTELFKADSDHIGISYIRISIGASDLDDHVFSYDDLPPGQTDLKLSQFNLEEDQKNLIPLLKEIISINPELHIMGSPWSAPAWMKSNGKVKGGSLKREFYKLYADYLVKYIQFMAREGITMNSLTIQNEPENPKNTPSMVMTAAEQLDFIKNFLGPAFKREKVETKILIYDHNCDHPEYPIEILNDSVAKKYIDGSAFHMYLGKIEAMSQVYKSHPDKNIYFTEQWTSGEGDFSNDLFWHTRYLIIGATRNWSSTVLEWNLASDPEFNPHTDEGGCNICQGALTIGDSIIRNVSYYIIAQASKIVRPGSYRIESDFINDLPNVAFITQSGNMVLIILNESNNNIHLKIKQNSNTMVTSLPAGSVVTYVW
jgi:glucosylceramidase